MNNVTLNAAVIEAKPIRYTPAGLPILELTLAHASDIEHAGMLRRVDLTIAATAIGDLALLLADITMGSQLVVNGFLAPQRKGAKRLILHLQSAQHLTSESTTVV